jgi:UDP-N-acetylmuramyl pentapeptide synthase
MADREELRERFNATSAKKARTLAVLADRGGLNEKTMEIVKSMLRQFEERGFLTVGQWALVKKIEREAKEKKKELDLDRALIAQLMKDIEDGTSPSTAVNFVASLATFLEERGFLTPAQREQAEHIRRRNVSPTMTIEQE